MSLKNEIGLAITKLLALVRNDRGASAIEYGLIAGLVAVGLVGALTLVGGNLTDTFDGIATALEGADSGGDSDGG